MKNICFFIGSCNDRSGKWNGEIIRKGGVGISGTDTSFIVIAEMFAANGWDVDFIASSCLNNTNYKGVNYYSNKEKRQYDILVIPPSEEFVKHSWNDLKILIIWCQMQHTFKDESFRQFTSLYPNCKIVANYMNQFTKAATNIYSPHTNYYINNEFFAPNPIIEDSIVSVSDKTPHSFIFNTSFRRGGEVALNIFNNIRYTDKSFAICSSYTDELNFLEGSTNIEVLHSIDKQTLFARLAETEYFIYPLVAPLEQGANVHKDTFCCAVAEALAHEVIVLSFPVGALPEMYENAIIPIPFPYETKKELHTSSYHSSGDEFYGSDVIKSVIDIIEFLEKNPQYKEALKKKGRELVLRKFNPDKIIELWFRIIREVLD
jgi:glycosyltransferase involved in cell wall biosynthesis